MTEMVFEPGEPAGTVQLRTVGLSTVRAVQGFWSILTGWSCRPARALAEGFSMTVPPGTGPLSGTA